VEEQTSQDPRLPSHRKSWNRNCRKLQRLLLGCSQYIPFISQILSLTYFCNPDWRDLSQRQTLLQAILPVTMYLTGVVGEIREGSERTKAPSPNFSTVYVWDLFDIFIYMNRNKGSFHSIWQVLVFYIWKTINSEVASFFFHSIFVTAWWITRSRVPEYEARGPGARKIPGLENTMSGGKYGV